MTRSRLRGSVGCLAPLAALPDVGNSAVMLSAFRRQNPPWVYDGVRQGLCVYDSVCSRCWTCVLVTEGAEC